MPMRGSMLVVSSAMATTSSASGSIANPSTIFGCANAGATRTTESVQATRRGTSDGIDVSSAGAGLDDRLLEQLDRAACVVRHREHLVELDLRRHAVALHDAVAPGPP